MDHYSLSSFSQYPNAPHDYIEERQINHEACSSSLSSTFGSSCYSISPITNGSQPDSQSSDFHTSPISASSQTTPSWEGRFNQFNINFYETSSLQEHDVLPTAYSTDSTPNSYQTWSTSPLQQLSPQQIPLSQKSSPPSTDIFMDEQKSPQLFDQPILDLPIAVVPARKRATSSKKPKSPSQDSRRSAIRRNRPSQIILPAPVVALSTTHEVPYVNTPNPLGGSWDPTILKAKKSKDSGEKERHKYVEMKYRMQMKDCFEELLRVLPVQGSRVGADGTVRHPELDKKMTRGKVLDLAREHIVALDRTGRTLERERDILQYQVGLYEAALLSSGLSIP